MKMRQEELLEKRSCDVCSTFEHISIPKGYIKAVNLCVNSEIKALPESQDFFI